MYIRVSIHKYLPIYIQIYVHIFIYPYIYQLTIMIPLINNDRHATYIRIYVCVHTHIHISMNINIINFYIHEYTNTYIYSHIFQPTMIVSLINDNRYTTLSFFVHFRIIFIILMIQCFFCMYVLVRTFLRGLWIIFL
jgi:hypothetical protein